MEDLQLAGEIQLTDESFQPGGNSTSHLSLLIEQDGLSFAILDIKSNRYLSVGRSEFSKNKISFPEFLTALPSGLFRSASAALAHPHAALIPSALFDESHQEELFAFHHPSEQGQLKFSDPLPGLRARNLFSADPELVRALEGQFPGIKLHHATTAFMEGSMMRYKGRNEPLALADFHPDYFTMIVLKGRELLYCNSFRYTNAEEAAYFLLFVYEQLGLNSETLPVHLSGHIGKNSDTFQLLFNYIRHVQFESLPDHFGYSYKFNDLPSHRFISLFNQYLCG